jgi:hypothetical protein
MRAISHEMSAMASTLKEARRRSAAAELASFMQSRGIYPSIALFEQRAKAMKLTPAGIADAAPMIGPLIPEVGEHVIGSESQLVTFHAEDIGATPAVAAQLPIYVSKRLAKNYQIKFSSSQQP